MNNIKSNWKNWKVGTPLYIVSQNGCFLQGEMKCPICSGTGKVYDPFTKEELPCSGFHGGAIHYDCGEGKIRKFTKKYSCQKCEIERFLLEYPSEKIKEIIVKRFIDDIPSSSSYVEYPLSDWHKAYYFDTEEEAQEFCKEKNMTLKIKEEG